jgi:branched-chain amino acid transport system ATP-binding protein
MKFWRRSLLLPESNDEILKVSEISKSFGGLKAVDRVDLSVQRGSITGLIGPNGSGKSTLFNLVTGLIKPDFGSVFLDGDCVDGLSPEKRFNKGMARSFQDPRLFFDMSVFENMLVAPIGQKGEHPLSSLFQRIWRQQELNLARKAKSVMDDFNIGVIASNGADEISGGQMKLLQLAQLLMNIPKIILLDEPTAGVAPSLTNEIFETIKRLRDEKQITFLIIEHKLQVLFKFVDTIYVMHRGKIFAKGTPQEIVSNPEIRKIYL